MEHSFLKFKTGKTPSMLSLHEDITVENIWEALSVIYDL